MNQLADFVINSFASSTATERLILLALAERASGMRIEEIARATGSRFRWVAQRVSALTMRGILCRVAPGTYALSNCAESRSKTTPAGNVLKG